MERKVILYLAMSLDGFIADKNGGVGWTSPTTAKPLKGTMVMPPFPPKWTPY